MTAQTPRTLLLNFYPSKLTPWLVRWVQMIFPAIAHWFYQLTVIPPQNSQALWETCRSQRVLLLANHPTFQDPIVLFLLSAHLRDRFHYLADLTQLRSRLGAFFQRMGTYSIRRGYPDRESVIHTLHLLAQPKCRLVIFPEGGCSFQNDTVMPFRDGAMRMALQALARLSAQQASSPDFSSPDFYVVPVSLKYRYTGNLIPVIATLLERLEQRLGLLPPSESEKGTPFHSPALAAPGLDAAPFTGPEQWLPDQGDTYQRLRRVGEAILQRFEADYGALGLTLPQEGKTLDDRISHLKAQLLQALETHLGTTAPADRPDRERVYHLQYLLEKQMTDQEESLDSLESLSPAVAPGTPPPSSPEMSPLASSPSPGTLPTGWTIERIQQALFRILNFDAICDGYVAENPTPERYLDTLTRFEREVFNIDQPSPKGHRQAWVALGEPLNLKDYLPAFQADRAKTVQDLTTHLHQVIQQNLDSL
ncbi:1-acyl-sn-glycerol-3-phosphate acyltransferase [Prochlorothrix hollandica]|uniref:1-acyl-sn-glycerol-3-phosphate acyltransferase n=1 Tax=Prochlorothrix hollandica TaxID=1223 RepID=UPI00333FE9B8